MVTEGYRWALDEVNHELDPRGADAVAPFIHRIACDEAAVLSPARREHPSVPVATAQQRVPVQP